VTTADVTRDGHSARRPTRPAHVGPRRPVEQPAERALARAVAAAVGRLSEIDRAGDLAGHTQRRRIETLLRDALERHHVLAGPPAAVPAVRVACAYLAAGDVEDAYLALLTARDLLR
jgi:hypothetical protein